LGRRQPEFSQPAAWWGSLDDKQKLLFVLGFYCAMGERCYFLTDIAETPHKVFEGTSTGAGIVRSMFQAAADLCNYSGISPSELVAHVTDFYTDPKNESIPYASALQYIRGKLTGEGEQELSEELVKLRNQHPPGTL